MRTNVNPPPPPPQETQQTYTGTIEAVEVNHKAEGLNKQLHPLARGHFQVFVEGQQRVDTGPQQKKRTAAKLPRNRARTVRRSVAEGRISCGRLRMAASTNDQRCWSRHHDPNPIVKTSANSIGSATTKAWRTTPACTPQTTPTATDAPIRNAKVAPSKVSPGKVRHGHADHRFEMDSKVRSTTRSKSRGSMHRWHPNGFEQPVKTGAPNQHSSIAGRLAAPHEPRALVPLWLEASANECVSDASARPTIVPSLAMPTGQHP